MQTRTQESPATVALKTGSAAVLICTGIIFLAARMFFDVYELIEGQSLEKPGSYAVGMMFAGSTRALGLATALGALLVMTLPFVCSFAVRELRFLILLYPAPLLARGIGSSVGWYLGSAIQLCVGAWLLGWLSRFTSRRGLNDVT
jgi:hypothetical protein